MKTPLAFTLGIILAAPTAALAPADEPAAYMIDLFSAPSIHTTEPAPHESVQESQVLPGPDELPELDLPEPDDVEPEELPEPEKLPELDLPESDELEVAPAALAAAAEGFELVTEPMETNEFAVAGVTWEGSAPDTVDVRALIDSEWTDWYSLEIELDGKPGTEPFMAAGATGIQVRASGAVAPTAFELSLNTGEGIGGTEEEADISEPEVEPEQSEDEPATNAAASTEAYFLPAELTTDATFINMASRALNPPSVRTVRPTDMPAPSIMSRSAWGARATDWPPETAKLSGAIIHHTAGSNTYTAAQAPSVVKAIWNYHTFGRGWGDIGYNFLVDKYGKIYEGRTGSLTSAPGKMTIGAHAAPANTGSVGISVLGNYTSIEPTQESLDSVASVLAWQFGRAGIDPFGSFSYRDRFGVMRSINAISGHLDVANTSCPGRIYGRLGEIRTQVAEEIEKVASLQPMRPDVVDVPTTMRYSYRVKSGHGWPATDARGLGDFNDDGIADLLLRRDGKLIFYAGRGNDRFWAGRQVGHGWSTMNNLFTGFDFDGDGRNDIVATHNDGTLYLYRGKGDGGVWARQEIGHGWHFAHIFNVAQGPGGKPALLAIEPGGDLYIYPTNGAGKFGRKIHVPGNYTHLIGAQQVGDWDGSGYTDAINIDADGLLHLYTDVTEGGYGERSKIGHGWGVMTQLLQGSSRGNLHNFYAIDKSGNLYSYVYRHRP